VITKVALEQSAGAAAPADAQPQKNKKRRKTVDMNGAGEMAEKKYAYLKLEDAIYHQVDSPQTTVAFD
jgi:hypothetical protein